MFGDVSLQSAAIQYCLGSGPVHEKIVGGQAIFGCLALRANLKMRPTLL